MNLKRLYFFQQQLLNLSLLCETSLKCKELEFIQITKEGKVLFNYVSEDCAYLQPFSYKYYFFNINNLKKLQSLHDLPEKVFNAVLNFLVASIL